MAYIEENLKIRSQPLDSSQSSSRDKSAEDEFTLSERWKTEKKAEVEEGSVTASLAMLTCIPEVDLGMEYFAPLNCAVSCMLTYMPSLVHDSRISKRQRRLSAR